MHGSFILRWKNIKKILKIWNRIKSIIKKELNSEPVYNAKYIKTKIKIYSDKVYTNFEHNKIPKDNDIVHVYL